MTNPTPFQAATVAAACRVLSSKERKPRYLVADEVGLGKTVVAQHLIESLAGKRDKPLVVYYVTNNLTIAAQNGPKLIEAVAEAGDVRQIICTADRLSMLPFSERPTHPQLHLYTLTPDTSLPGRKRSNLGGRKEERALIAVLMKRCWPNVNIDDAVFRHKVRSNWDNVMSWANRTIANKGDHERQELDKVFKKNVRSQLGLSKKKRLQAALKQLQDRHGEAYDLKLMAHLRSALIDCTFELNGLQPDLVIFDEFQRFRDLVLPAVTLNGKQLNPANSALAQLRGDSDRRVPLLLLSATPYSLDDAGDENSFFGAHDQFLDLLCFLFGGDNRAREHAETARNLFNRFGDLLRSQTLDFDALKRVKENIESHLTQVISRTERALVQKDRSLVPNNIAPMPLEVTTEAADWRAFRHLSERFPKQYHASAITYWRSVPVPMQMLGSGYMAWKAANKSGIAATIPAFTKQHVDKHRKYHWPNAKLRKLIEHADPGMLCLPWVPPSLPWWALAKPWKTENAIRGKILLFSRFRATPKAVAAALSHESRVYAARQRKLPKSGAHLPLTAKRMPVFALFYPSLWLACCCDPVVAAGKRPADVKADVRRQLVDYLNKAGIKEATKVPKRDFWKVLAALEGRFDKARSNVKRLEPREVSEIWRLAAQQTTITSLSRGEIDLLVSHALGSPGVVLTRSLLRHFPSVNKVTYEYEALRDTCLRAWRNYFDNAVFVATLRRNQTYPDALKCAIFDGNLEASLDEHIWYISKSGGFMHVLDEFSTSLGVRGGRVAVHNANNANISVRCQCDVAMPLAQDLESNNRVGEMARPPRADHVRKAFNSPFWPFVLATTSVGQEGLDFHPWCQTLLHWDLPGSAIALEQREGRVERYAGLAVRRQMGMDNPIHKLPRLVDLKSPWVAIATKMDEHQDETNAGLAPWWTYPKATVNSYFFHIANGEEVAQLEELKRLRAIYRLALGQQHQEDLIRIVGARDLETIAQLVRLTPDLSAWARQNVANDVE